MKPIIFSNLFYAFYFFKFYEVPFIMLFWLFNLLLLCFSTATAHNLAAPVVDLHYALYEGYYSSTYDQTFTKGKVVRPLY